MVVITKDTRSFSLAFCRGYNVLPWVAALALTACGKPPPEESLPTSCLGDKCLYWTTAEFASCEQINDDKRNLAYQTQPQHWRLTRPINLFFKVIQKDPGGTDIHESGEQVYRVSAREPTLLPICTVAKYNGIIVTQRIHPNCITNRTLPNNATSADCTADEQKAAEIIPTDTSFRYIGAKFISGSQISAPSTAAIGKSIDCSNVCGPNGTGECFRIRSRDLNAKLFNLVNAWKPGLPVDKKQLMAVAGLKDDKCNRENAVLSNSGAVSNKGEYCPLEFDTDGETSKLEILPSIEGSVVVRNGNKQVLFENPGKALQLQLPGDIAVFGGPVVNVSVPSATSAIDVRTHLMCFRIY